MDGGVRDTVKGLGDVEENGEGTGLRLLQSLAEELESQGLAGTAATFAETGLLGRPRWLPRKEAVPEHALEKLEPH